MRIGINLDCFGGLSVAEEIRLMKENGFDATFMMSDRGDVDAATEACAKAGIAVENYHAPFWQINDVWSEDPATGEAMLGRLLESVDTAHRNGVPAIVVHLSSGKNPPRINNVGMERFARLNDYAKQRGVKLAFENQRKLTNLAFSQETFPDAAFCWDVGHETCFMENLHVMPLFGKRIAALHVHDNDMQPDGDLHMIPFDGKIDFNLVARTLAESPFRGALMLEVIRGNSNAYQNVTAEAYYRRAAEAATRLSTMVETYWNVH